MGNMEFPPESLAFSHSIAFHAVVASGVFFSMFGTPAGSVGQSGKIFWYVKTTCEWCSSVGPLGKV